MALDVHRAAVCSFAGFVLVKKVPGTLHLLAKSPGHSFDFVAMNMSHVVHQWFFGNKPSPRRRTVRGRRDRRPRCPPAADPALHTAMRASACRACRWCCRTTPYYHSSRSQLENECHASPDIGQALARLHPLGLTDDWADKLAGESFTSPNQRVTHEHYSQVGALLNHLHVGGLLLHLSRRLSPCNWTPSEFADRYTTLT